MMVTLSNPLIPVITIDGPSGAGKGAIASNLSALLDGIFLIPDIFIEQQHS